MPTFDPAQYLDMETDQAATKRPPLPVGDYMSLIGDVEVVPWTSETKGTSGLQMKIPHKVQLTPEVRAQLGLADNVETITLTNRVFLDTTDQGLLDWSPGKNGGLRRYREALDQNKAGEPWSPRRMAGRPCVVKVKHEVYKGEATESIDGVAKP